jgi:hypothetical protein
MNKPRADWADKLWRLWMAGTSTAAIAAELDWPKNTVCSRVGTMRKREGDSVWPMRSAASEGGKSTSRKMGQVNKWTDEEIDRLRKLWGETRDRRLCAKELGRPSSSVGAQVHRMRGIEGPSIWPIDGNKKNGPSIARAVGLTQGAPPPDVEARAHDRAMKATSGEGVDFDALTFRCCRWPLTGADGVHRFCGAPRRGGEVWYCEDHAALSIGAVARRAA